MMEYNRSDGLPDELVKDIEQDNFGYIWLATDNGLFCFDGNNYLKVEVPQGQSEAFKSLHNFESENKLIVCSDNAVYKINWKNGIPFLEYFIENNPCPIAYPKQIFDDSENNIWIAGNRTIMRYESNGSIKLFDFSEDDYTNSYSRSFQFFEVRPGESYVISETGNLFYLDEINDSFIQLPWEIDVNNCYATAVLINGKVLLGGDNGLYELYFEKPDSAPKVNLISSDINPSDFHIVNNKMVIVGTWSSGLYYLNYEDSSGWKVFGWSVTDDRNINAILTDSNNMLWIASDNGFAFFYPDLFHDVGKKRFLQSVNQLFDYKDKIFFSTSSQLFSVGINNDKPIVIFEENDSDIISICNINEKIYVGLSSGELFLIENNGNNSWKREKIYDFENSIRMIESDDDGNLWILIDNDDAVVFRLNGDKTLFKLNKKNGVSETPICLSIVGDTVILSLSKEIKEWNKDENSFSKSIAINLFSEENVIVNEILKMPNNSYLLATRKGLYVIGDSSYVLNYGKEYLEEVKSIAFDKAGRLWFTISQGVIRLIENSVTKFDDKDGLRNKISTIRTLLFDKNDNCWVGTVSGLSRTKGISPPMITPTPIIDNFEGAGDVNKYFKTASFPNDMYLSLSIFSSIYPANYNLFTYKLQHIEDSEAPIVELSDNRLILTDLQKGEYILTIWAKHKGNYIGSEGLVYKFSVYTVWYQRVSTWILVLLLIMGLIVLYVFWHSYNVKKENKRLESLIAERTVELKQRNLDLREVNQSKDRFFAILAHDLRSPFNVLINSSTLIIEEWEDLSEKELKSLIDGIRHTSDRTYILLENLLQWSRSETGKLNIVSEDFNIMENIDFTLQMSREAASAKQITMYCDMQSAYVYADKSMTDTVLRNLVGNALKFTRKDGDIRISTRELLSKEIEISVSDNGVGISSERIERLFDLANNESTFGTSNEKGSGLGLVICKEFVEKMGGKLSVESQEGVGTTFTFLLPEAKGV